MGHTTLGWLSDDEYTGSILYMHIQIQIQIQTHIQIQIQSYGTHHLE